MANDVAAPPPAAPAAVDPETPSVVVAAPAPAAPAHQIAGTLLVGAGVASPIARAIATTVSSPGPLPSVKVAGQLRGTGATTGFGEIGLVADLPRARSSVSWDRFTVEPLGGVAFRAEGTTVSVGGGLSLGVLEIDERSFGSSIYRWFDIAAVAEARAGLTLGPAPRDLGLWAALRGRAALRDVGYTGQGPWGPDSRYELALLVGAIFLSCHETSGAQAHIGGGRMRSALLPSVLPAAVRPTINDLYRAHAGDVRRWALRLGGGRLDADDVVQEVFLVASRRQPVFDGDARPATWLFQVTARVAANHRRRSWLRRFWSHLAAQVPDRGTPAEQWPDAPSNVRERVGELYEMLDRLPARQREAIVLFELEEMTSEAIATLMGVPHATVRVWLHRARERLAREAAERVVGGES